LSNNTARDLAEAARKAAAATTLQNVREREIRSAEAYEAIAERTERVSASSNRRQAEAAVRKSGEAFSDEEAV
jgi:hypothetical protein